ncbi:MAG TPA: M23 family metallopeptidase, partial [Paraburkholderia sp.]|nr:M23 family metallopeptidase [Paraburkholderia sp.]
MSSMLFAGSRLSSGSVSFVTRRTAVIIAGGAAIGTAALALAVGIAIGMHWPAHDAPGQQASGRIARDYAIGELGKLNASVAQIEPRIARLTEQVGALRDFESRLNTPRPSPRAPAGLGGPAEADDSVADSEGGPLLPPRRCVDVIPQPDGHADPARTQQQLDCISATLSALERQNAGHEMAYNAFPGRMPADGARFGSPFGNRADPFTHRLSFHPGLDLVAPTGTPILAAAGGRVIFAGEKSGYGNAVEIDHGNGLVTRYGHASRILVR